jgi:hypothetical protein
VCKVGTVQKLLVCPQGKKCAMGMWARSRIRPVPPEGPLLPSPATPEKDQKNTKKQKGVKRCYSFFWTVLTHCQLRRWVWSWVVAVLGLAVVLHPAVLVEFAPPASVSVYRPGQEFGDSPIPAGNCGPVSSDVHIC